MCEVVEWFDVSPRLNGQIGLQSTGAPNRHD
jgi:hypothetical protein